MIFAVDPQVSVRSRWYKTRQPELSLARQKAWQFLCNFSRSRRWALLPPSKCNQKRRLGCFSSFLDKWGRESKFSSCVYWLSTECYTPLCQPLQKAKIETFMSVGMTAGCCKLQRKYLLPFSHITVRSQKKTCPPKSTYSHYCAPCPPKKKNNGPCSPQKIHTRAVYEIPYLPQTWAGGPGSPHSNFFI